MWCRAQREAARGRKSEWKVNLLSRNSSRSNGSCSWWMTPKRTMWQIDLHQLTVFEQFRWVNMRAVTFSFVDQSSSCGLEKFGVNIPTSSKVIAAHTLQFKSNFKYSSSIFFWRGGRGPHSSKSCAISSGYKIWGHSTPQGPKYSLPKNVHLGGSICTSIAFCLWTKVHHLFCPTREGL